MRMPSLDALSHYLIPIVAAAVLVIAYFAIFNRWTSFDNPINSIVCTALGVVGFAIGAAADVARVGIARRNTAGGKKA